MSDRRGARERYYGMPAPIRRRQPLLRLPLVVMVVMSVVQLVWKVPAFSLWLNSGTFMLAAQLGVLPWVMTRQRRLHREWTESGGRLCTRCAHSLKGLPDEGVCPECGQGYDVVRDRAAWKRGGLEGPRGPGWGDVA